MMDGVEPISLKTGILETHRPSGNALSRISSKTLQQQQQFVGRFGAKNFKFADKT